MATDPAFAATPKIEHANTSTANTARDGTGTWSTIATAGASGRRIDRVTWTATGTTTAGNVKLAISTDGGTTKRYYAEQSVSAITPSATVLPASGAFSFPAGLNLPASAILYAAPEKAESFNFIAEGGDL